MIFPQVIYEEKDFLVINKPAGLLVHGSKSFDIAQDKPNLVSWLLKNYPEVKNVGDDPQNRPGIVHRLDKETSGVILVPRTQESYIYFKNLFLHHQIKKNYLALVYGMLKEKEGIINLSLGLKPDSVRRTAFIKKAKMVKEAITKYKVKKIFGEKYSLLEVEPLTGRTHQIRVHLASIGHSIVGDKLYGPKKQADDLGRQFLHAESMELTTMNGRRLKVAADMPEDLREFLKQIT